MPAASGNTNGTCKNCGGLGLIKTPNGQKWQSCPNCDGQGTTQGVIRVPWSLQWNAALTSGQTGVPVITQQDSDADFEVIYVVASSILANGAAGLFSIQRKDNSTGRNLDSGQVNGELCTGTAQLPHVLPEPYIISRTGTFQLTFNERSVAGVVNNVQVVMHGYKLFPAQAPQQGSSGAIVPSNS